jgi:glycogen debranching enzyme
VLKPTADGLLESAAALPVAFMAPRLQGEWRPDGGLSLALWGAGALGKLSLTGLEGPFTYGPNGGEAARRGFYVAQSAPALALTGVRLRRLTPARRSAAWDAEPAVAATDQRGGIGRVRLPWGVVLVEQRGPDLVVAAGEDLAEAEAGLGLSVAAIQAEARGYAAACDRLPEAEPLLRSMVRQGVHAALASVRSDSAGRFAGMAAGSSYSAPARTYFRDSYWTLPLLFQVAPERAAAQIDLLATAVRPDGEAPSAVLVGAPEQRARFEAWRIGGAETAAWRPGEWWSDHFDSPLVFVLAVADRAAATGEQTTADRHWPLLEAVFERYAALAGAGGGLPLKPRHDRDWADNVYRSGAVAYDVGLWVGVADAVARLAADRDAGLAARAHAAAQAARAALDGLWWDDHGWCADYRALDGSVEPHLALDSLTLLRFGALPEARARRVLAACAERLESRRNTEQPFGDWGMLCAWPPYRRRSDLRAKSAFPLRYHNGGDWPWLDGLYAEERLRRGLPGWRYPLLRWWEACLANGWTSPVEHYSPGYGRGSLLQAWSSLPAAVALKFSAAVLGGDPEARSQSQLSAATRS